MQMDTDGICIPFRAAWTAHPSFVFPQAFENVIAKVKDCSGWYGWSFFKFLTWFNTARLYYSEKFGVCA